MFGYQIALCLFAFGRIFASDPIDFANSCGPLLLDTSKGRSIAEISESCFNPPIPTRTFSKAIAEFIDQQYGSSRLAELNYDLRSLSEQEKNGLIDMLIDTNNGSCIKDLFRFENVFEQIIFEKLYKHNLKPFLRKENYTRLGHQIRSKLIQHLNSVGLDQIVSVERDVLNFFSIFQKLAPAFSPQFNTIDADSSISYTYWNRIIEYAIEYANDIRSTTISAELRCQLDQVLRHRNKETLKQFSKAMGSIKSKGDSRRGSAVNQSILLFNAKPIVFESSTVDQLILSESTYSQLLLELDPKGMSQQTIKDACLADAIQLDNTNLAKALIFAGANVNAVDGSGGSVLSHALRNKNQTLVWILIENGANLNQLSHHKSPLWYAVGTGYISFVQKLLDHYADPNIGTNLGHGPLYYACRKGLGSIATLLLDRGAVCTDQHPYYTQWHLLEAFTYGFFDVASMIVSQDPDRFGAIKAQIPPLHCGMCLFRESSLYAKLGDKFEKRVRESSIVNVNLPNLHCPSQLAKFLVNTTKYFPNSHFDCAPEQDKFTVWIKVFTKFQAYLVTKRYSQILWGESDSNVFGRVFLYPDDEQYRKQLLIWIQEILEFFNERRFNNVILEYDAFIKHLILAYPFMLEKCVLAKLDWAILGLASLSGVSI